MKISIFPEKTGCIPPGGPEGGGGVAKKLAAKADGTAFAASFGICSQFVLKSVPVLLCRLLQDNVCRQLPAGPVDDHVD